MTFQEFVEFHAPALEADEVRFNVLLSIMSRALAEFPAGLHYWTLGGPGSCAIARPDRPLQLGALDAEACQRLARETRELSYPGVAGEDGTARWFVEEATTLGLAFPKILPLSIQVLREPPRYPEVEGAARAATGADAPLLLEWIGEFQREAVPHDPAPQLENIAKEAASGRYLFWTVGGEPVSVAGIARKLKTARGIAPVYTPPEKRARGYAGAATAAVCERIFAEGSTAACLYVDQHNPYSNRCYAKIGFKRHCDSWHYIRAL